MTQLGMEADMNFWTRGFKIPITILTLNFLLITKLQYIGWLYRGEDVIMEKTENIPNLLGRS